MEKYIHTHVAKKVDAFEEVTACQTKPKKTYWIYDIFKLGC